MSQKNRRIKRIRTLTKQRHRALEEVRLLRNSECSRIADLEIRLAAAQDEAEHWRAEYERAQRLTKLTGLL